MELTSDSDAPLPPSSTRDPLTAWHDNFKIDVRTLRQLLQLRTRTGDTAAREDMKPTLSEIALSITQLEEAVAAVRGYAAAERHEAARLQAFSERVVHQTQRIALIRANLSPSVAAELGVSDVDKENSSAVVNSDPHQLAAQWGSSEVFSAVVPQNKKKTKPLVSGGAGAPNPTAISPAADHSAAAAPATTRGRAPAVAATEGKAGPKARPKEAKGRAPAPSVEEEKQESVGDGPIVRAITSEELAAAPQYVRGRLTVEKVDEVARRLTAVAQAKYDLLRKPLSKLSPADRTQVESFRDAESSETDGLVFLTDEEIKSFGKMRLDSNVKGSINLLRHVHCIKELRGKNRARVFVIN